MADEEITIDEQIAEVERELKLRDAVYPRWVEAKKLKKETAERQVARLRAVHTTLMRVKHPLITLKHGD